MEGKFYSNIVAQWWDQNPMTDVFIRQLLINFTHNIYEKRNFI